MYMCYPSDTGYRGNDVTWGDLNAQASQTIRYGLHDTRRPAVLWQLHHLLMSLFAINLR